MEKSALERLQEVLDRLTADEGGCPYGYGRTGYTL